jgi:hypothetical protein
MSIRWIYFKKLSRDPSEKDYVYDIYKKKYKNHCILYKLFETKPVRSEFDNFFTIKAFFISSGFIMLLGSPWFSGFGWL